MLNELEDYDLSTTFDDIGVIEEQEDVEYEKLCKKMVKEEGEEGRKSIGQMKSSKKRKSFRKTAQCGEFSQLLSVPKKRGSVRNTTQLIKEKLELHDDEDNVDNHENHNRYDG